MAPLIIVDIVVMAAGSLEHCQAHLMELARLP
jgi:hypothetical protein